MGSVFSPTLIILLSIASSSCTKTEAQGIKSAPLLDLFIRDYAFQSYSKYSKTGKFNNVHLPANLSGIQVSTARFRCGSLRRYGARFNEFHLGVGLIVHPCVERVMLVAQNLGSNWSSIYYENYELSGYTLVSPVLGLLAYNAGDDTNFSNPFEVNILAGKNAIAVDFAKIGMLVNDTNGLIPVCASFGHDGKVTLAGQVGPSVCAANGQGHYGLVVESPLVPEKNKRVSRWKLVVGTTVGAALGASLLGLLFIALFANVKKKARLEELERRAYEEEALQVTMVGHMRAPTAPGTRTVPAIEQQYRPPPSRNS